MSFGGSVDPYEAFDRWLMERTGKTSDQFSIEEIDELIQIYGAEAD